MESKNLKESYYRYLRYFLAKDENTATANDKYMALAYAVRSEMVDSWIQTQRYYSENNVRRVYFLSMEYVFGKSLHQNLMSLGIEEPLTSAVRSLGFSIEEIYAQEDDFELGNTGKGRQAVCQLESMSTLGIPAMAYGLRYDYAQFQQDIKNGLQVERPLDWLHRGHPWEIIRPEYSCSVQFAGDCKPVEPTGSTLSPSEWNGAELIHAVPYDFPIPGFRNNVVNTLRLWSARASEEFLPDYANHNDYIRACEEKSQLGRITKVLFPDEDVRRATELRMKQQFFFISAALQDIIRRYKVRNSSLDDLDKKIVIQLNGSRCALAIPEMMRLLVDVERMPWDKAWNVTKNIFAYTSYAVLRDNLEMWPVYKVAQILPRHMQIIFDINQIHLESLRTRFNLSPEIVRELSLIEEGEVKRIRLANLAIVGAFSVNGVSKEQSDVLSRKLFPQFSNLFPERFNNKTIGVSHRRWLLCANKEFVKLIERKIGNKWEKNPSELQKLEEFSNDMAFLFEMRNIKKAAKDSFIKNIEKFTSLKINSDALFDAHCGKIHPYKRQVLHILFVLHRYLQIKNGVLPKVKRVHIFAGKASPSDYLAKQIIHLINLVADLINNDQNSSQHLQMLFIPNFGMSWAEKIITAADLNEQIATASFEPSGSFSLKFALNNCLAISSRCGTNLELAEKIGDNNMFLFGKTSDEIMKMPMYKPADMINSDERLKSIFLLLDKTLAAVPDGHAIFPLLSSIRDTDRYFVLTDFDDYVRAQDAVDLAYADSMIWNMKSLLSVARAGWFSSDRAIREYAQEIWKVPSL
jgi:starch phosphorylase